MTATLDEYMEAETKARMRFYREDRQAAEASVRRDVDRRVCRLIAAASRSTPPPPTPEWIIGSDAARAVGRFRPEGVLGYRAKSAPDAPLRSTRGEAECDERAWFLSSRSEGKEVSL